MADQCKEHNVEKYSLG